MKTQTKFLQYSVFLFLVISNQAFAGHLEQIKSQTSDKKIATSQNNEQSFAKLLKETDPKIINALENVTLEMHSRFMPSEIALMIGALSLLATIGAGIYGHNMGRGSSIGLIQAFTSGLLAFPVGIAGGAITFSTYGSLKILELYKRRKFAKKFAKMLKVIAEKEKNSAK